MNRNEGENRITEVSLFQINNLTTRPYYKVSAKCVLLYLFPKMETSRKISRNKHTETREGGMVDTARDVHYM